MGRPLAGDLDVCDNGYIEVEGGRVAYWRVGESDKEPLVCLHGGPGLPHDYLEPLAALADERPVLFYDQLGCGQSDRPEDSELWVFERFVAELGTVVNALGIEKFHLFGNSWGGWLALEYAVSDFPPPTSLAINGSPPSVPRIIEDNRKLRQDLPAEVREALDRHEKSGYTTCPEYAAGVYEFYRRHLCRLCPWPDALDRSFAGLGTPVYEHMWGPTEFGPVTGLLKDWDFTERLGQVRQPTLVAIGRHDEARPEHCAVLVDRIPNARAVFFDDSSHMPFHEEPEVFLSTVRDFISEHEADSRQAN